MDRTRDKGLHDHMVRKRKAVSPLVDAVARAICSSYSCEGAWCCQNQRSRKPDCLVDRGGYDAAAKAAIAAMRESPKEQP